MLDLLKDLKLIFVELCDDFVALKRLLFDDFDRTWHLRASMLANFDYAVITLAYLF